MTDHEAWTVEAYEHGLRGTYGATPCSRIENLRETGARARRRAKAINVLVAEAEAGFSWRRCECCGSPLGGSRHAIAAWSERDDALLMFSACVDCLQYCANGTTPEECAS